MIETYAAPSFGGKARPDAYYAQVDAIIATLRGKASQRTIAGHLNAVGITTPKGLVWDRQKLACYLRNTRV
jgi:hypothetical protein